MSFLSALYVLLLVFATESASRAEVVLHDTTANGFDTNWLVGMVSGTGTTINQPADSFVVGGGDFFLDSLTLDLGATTLTGGTPDDYVVRFWDNDVDKPGNLLESFPITNSSSLTDPVTLSSTATPVLSDGEMYWVSAALPDDLTNGSWAGVQGGPSSGRAVTFSGAETATWIATTTERLLYLKVTGTPVPEPAALLLAAVAGAVTFVRGQV